MVNLFFVLGAAVSFTLIGLLGATILNPPLRLWPTPGAGTWQSYVFWPLFRGLNVLCIAMALVSAPASDFGLPIALRILAFAILVGSIATFVYAFQVLGRDNSYGAQDGLVTGGIYQWSRNPQNAMLIVVYGALALASDSRPTMLLCGAMMAVYALMVLAEEPWLKSIYGDAYTRYCNEIPRFFHWQRAVDWLRRNRT